ncbi:MAG: hypothetical protein ACK5MY_17895 [Jhaorihella sp.]
MMICNADFDELFPATAKAARRAMPDPACFARWEDDGGSIGPVDRPRSRRRALPAGFGTAMPESVRPPVLAGVALAMLPVLIANEVTSAMFAARGSQPRA